MNTIVYSLWTTPSRDFEQYRDLLKISKYYAKQFHPNFSIILVTDSKGKDICKDLKFAEISTILNDIPFKYHKFWSIGKLFAFEYAAEKYGSFLHLDADVILTKSLPDNILQAGIIAQSPEHFNKRDFYGIANNEIEYPNKKTYLAAPNMGITGGTDLDFFKSLKYEAIKFINKNEILLNREDLHPAAAAVWVEQWLMGAYANKLGKKINYLFNNDFPSERQASQKGYIHLWGRKNDKKVRLKVKELLRRIKD